MLWLLLVLLVIALVSLVTFYQVKKHFQPRIWEDSDEEVQRLPVQKKRKAEPAVIEKTKEVQEEVRSSSKQKVSMKQAFIYNTVFDKPLALKETDGI